MTKKVQIKATYDGMRCFDVIPILVRMPYFYMLKYLFHLFRAHDFYTNGITFYVFYRWQWFDLLVSRYVTLGRCFKKNIYVIYVN